MRLKQFYMYRSINFMHKKSILRDRCHFIIQIFGMIAANDIVCRKFLLNQFTEYFYCLCYKNKIAVHLDWTMIIDAYRTKKYFLLLIMWLFRLLNGLVRMLSIISFHIFLYVVFFSTFSFCIFIFRSKLIQLIDKIKIIKFSTLLPLFIDFFIIWLRSRVFFN